jgi:hypothetical protein
MSIEQAVLRKLYTLPEEQRQEVLDFVDFLHAKMVSKQPRRSIRGLWANMDIDITDEDIAEARREMWGNFPREDI